MKVQRQDTVAILMGCYNGAAHLQAQLDSIAAQTHRSWILVAADDGSTDHTLELLARFRERMGHDRVFVRAGPRKGFLANFLTLACEPGINAEYFAFSDQDDVWEPEKLERALAVLNTASAAEPALYCSRTRLIDEADRCVGFSPLFRRTPCFRNALVQSIAGGNTMVFNEAARRLLRTAGADAAVASHDWWLYLLTSGAGGLVHYDAWASVAYRQHGTNLVGGNVGWHARLDRFVRLLQGRFSQWNTMHCEALKTIEYVMTEENREIFELFLQSRMQGLLRRVSGVARARLFRQTPMGNLGLYASVVMNKF